MRRLLAPFFAAIVLAQAPIADARQSRSAAAKASFKRADPCPSTGQSRGPCPSFHVDHIKPLCAGGQDHPANMQWLHVGDHKAKTREDVRACRSSR